jgi:hypothetical protein
MDSLNAAFVHFLFPLNLLSGLRVNRNPTAYDLAFLLYDIRVRQLLKLPMIRSLAH